MFIVMIKFVVKEGFEEKFINKWEKVTQGIYLFKGSLGSRLHKSEDGELIAYAQWPDKETWEKSYEVAMSEQYEQERQLMFDSLDVDTTEIVHKMEVITDYLQVRPFEKTR